MLQHKKKILIDASTVIGQVDGLSIYIINLIRHLSKESLQEFAFFILVNKNVARPELQDLRKIKELQFIEADIPTIGPKRDWKMFWFLRKHKNEFDLIHITSNTYPLALHGGVCTVHDVTFKKHFDKARFPFNLAPHYISILLKRCLKNAKAVIAVSGSTKKELMEAYSLTERTADKVHVVHEGWEHLVEKTKTENCTELIQLDKNYIFYLGTSRKHKNLSGLLTAFKLALPHIPSSVKLVISGSNKHLDISDLAIFKEINEKAERVLFTGYLPTACLQKYYNEAAVFILPSLAEGFGIPILEAFYYNCPVLCSNTTSLPEVAGDAALYFDPYLPSEMADTIIDFFQNSELSNRLKDAGRKRLEHFSWEKTSKETVDIYKKCLLNN